MEFDIGIFRGAVISWPFAEGALITLALAVLSHAVGIAGGLGLALLGGARRPLRARIGRAVFVGYIWLFRGVPVLLLLLFVWNGLPQLIPALRESWFTPFLAAWLALGLNEIAYQAEISRAALLSVPDGQREVAAALGLRPAQSLAFVVLPQAVRVALPPTANEFITLLKTTSLASVISLPELLAVTSRASSVTFRYTEFYAAALVYYLGFTTVLMLGQAWLERRLRTGTPTLLRH